MHRQTLVELDFYRIRDFIAGKCVSEEGKYRLLRREPFTSDQIEEISRYKALSSQWQKAITSKNPVHLHAWPEIFSFLKILKAEGATLEQDQLYSILIFCDSSLDLYSTIKTASKELSLKSLLDLSETLPYSTLQQAQNAISRIIDKNGNLKDIPALREIRAKIASIKAEINSVLRKFTSDSTLNNVLETNVPAFRADRQVLAVKANMRNRVSGIVHEVSSSGQTLFIEPDEVVRKNNELIQEEFHLMQETRKIFTELTAQIHPFYEDLKSALETMILFDVTYAAASWGAENLCNYAFLPGEEAPLLIQARHPLLGEKAVPIDIKFLAGKNILIITGPNTGGKTVTLKTFALLSLLNQCGFPIPAAEGTRLPIFDSIFADIGDEQSIDQSLSTFSAHMKNIAAAVKHADSKSLVLLDELGSGTDPQEGGAIAMATLDALIEKHAFVLVTTHHGILKNYGYTNEFCVNASAEFDQNTLSPTYRLLMGVPGESHALDIAKRSGLPGNTVQKAKNYITNQQADVSTLIKGLTEKHAELIKREKEFSENEIRQKEKILKLEQKELKLKLLENQLKERESRTESRFLRETRSQLENLVRELREGEITREKTLKMRKFIDDLTEDVEMQELALEEEREQLESQQKELEERIENETVIAENGIKISRSSDNRTASTKKTKKKLSNKEALANAKQTYTDEEIFNLNVPKKKNAAPIKMEFAEGATVLAGPSRSKGTLLHEEKKGVWLVQLGSIRMSIKEKDMQLVSPAGVVTGSAVADYSVELNKNDSNGSPLFELRLLGMREEEAIKALQRQLDLCCMTNFKSFSVIHGKGNGILQQAVQDYLSNYPGIKSFYYARPEDGGFGKTYVEMN
ncbi:MAG: Smr/MutS family protein [Treponema sp.]|nr:Smr/MutS family protein [Candidatus Treponema equifaecale]